SLRPRVAGGEAARIGQVLAAPPETSEETTLPAVPILSTADGKIEFVREGGRRRPKSIRVSGEIVDRRDYAVPANARLRVEGGEFVTAGEQLTEGSLNPHDVLAILGPEVCQLYLVDEVQKVYRSQGVNINDRHIEVIVRQMMRRVEITHP